MKNIQPTTSKEENKTTEEQIKKAEAKFERLLEGCLDDLPNLPHSTVRIFMSSTFSDMRAERNAIVRDVNPFLKEYCAKYDLDFQIVDMRWGVTDDSQNEHSVEKICLLEVENCQNLSLGPNFIFISGDRYGFRPIPVEIDKEEFDTIKKLAEKNSLSDTKLLDIWYLLDENAKPPLYILQPIRSQFTFFGDYTSGCEEQRAKDAMGWAETFKSLQTVLRKAATLACKSKQFSKDKLHKYFYSVTEIEVNKGILNSKEPNLHTSTYQRDLHGLDITDDTIKKYCDTTMENGKMVFDGEARLLREKIRKQIPSALKKSGRIHQYQVKWHTGGIDPEKHVEQRDYIRHLCADLIKDICELIDKAREDQKGLIRTEYYTDYQEVLHHQHFCKLKCETFCGRDDVLQQSKEYILMDKSRRPLIIYAPSGAGKTSVMSKILQSLPEWFKEEPHIGIIRFLGTSPYSLNIYDVLYGICGQLADCAKLLMEPVGCKNMKKLVEYMPRLLRRVSAKVKKPIVILLDSLDQLTAKDDSYLLNWLPAVLPSNLRMIVSTVPGEHEILDTLKKLFPDTTNFVEVPALPDDTCFDMIDIYLAKKKRTVTQIQKNKLVRAFRKCRGPLFLKLILDEAVNWNSYTPIIALNLKDSVQGAINLLFENMEKKFGQVLISHALGYITVAYNGISDLEWEDVLSCDDEVLDDIYRYHDPPVPGIVQMPPVLVARIRHDLREYIVERRSFGKTTLNWYHRQFIETAHGRYATGSAGKKLHKVLAQYFIANDGIQRDITLHRRKRTVEKADRQVTKQPLVVKNQRKLLAVPYHITHAGNQIDPSIAKSKCFCNLKFLTVRIQSLPLSTWVDDMTAYLDKTDDEEVALLRNYFLVSGKSGNGSGTNLSINLLSHLHVDESQKYLKELLQQAEDTVYSSESPLLIPVFPCLAPRKDASSDLLKIYDDVDDIISSGSESVLMTNVKEGDGDEKGYLVYDSINNDVYQLSHNKEFNAIMPPILDHSEKRVINLGRDSFQIFHLHNQVTNMKRFSDMFEDLGKSMYPTMSCLSTDFLHLTILFSNGDVLILDTNSFKKVDFITLGEEASDVSNIITTSIDNLKIIFTINTVVSEKENEKDGVVRIHVVGAAENGKMVKTYHPFTRGLAAVGFNENLLVVSSNRETDGTLTVVNLDEVKITILEYCSSKLMQLSVAHSHALAAIWLEQGFVAVYDISNGEVVQQLNIDNTITSFGVSWINDLVFIGDNQGQIIMYKAQTGKHFGDFKAENNEIVKVAVLEDQVVTVSKKNTAKVWELTTFLNTYGNQSSKTEANGEGSELMAQKDIIGFEVDFKGQCIITTSEDKHLRIWSLDSVQLQKKIYIGITGHKVSATINSMCIVLDNQVHLLKGLDFEKGLEKMSMRARNVLSFCQGENHKTLYLLKTGENNHFVEIIDIVLLKPKTSFLLKQKLAYESIDLSISKSERYLIVRVKILEKEYADIQTSCRKQGGGFLPQSHRHRFYAIDKTQATGGLMPCNRILTNIPHLGEVVCPYQGNVMMVTTHLRVVFWDIPTGKCDQRVTKGVKLGFMYRRDHLSTSCEGTSLAVEQSENRLYVAIGSEDGYMIVWEADTGFPVGRKEPTKRHTASVVTITISPDSKWVASRCLNNMLILWDITTGTDVVQLKIPSDVQQMKFTADSKHLVINTGSGFHNTRMLVYRLHPGQQ
ncbi:NACHT domain- and WD repeat-containing protein 1-like [Mytilus californianus]|uniref:NACHT domain- and WD repeat-containing protein 1-like n=1 Tax=Mytilus californianus TaxID=6549 RepID=UPI0022473633|nr:NACHT domain- and WD repeat-containing protein 1-like [Mytilus californianus]